MYTRTHGVIYARFARRSSSKASWLRLMKTSPGYVRCRAASGRAVLLLRARRHLVVRLIK